MSLIVIADAWVVWSGAVRVAAAGRRRKGKEGSGLRKFALMTLRRLRRALLCPNMDVVPPDAVTGPQRYSASRRKHGTPESGVNCGQDLAQDASDTGAPGAHWWVFYRKQKSTLLMPTGLLAIALQESKRDTIVHRADRDGGDLNAVHTYMLYLLIHI
ncbi:hypothetical protein BDN70DRAFT_893314 [Pholiota conissans]|uniref:Uncharacterized protein n=1 Tax=Pholiota conissans TaxID=109636 RepID=A0A9P5Z8Q4_9AGAR|nr:hypothetical protein BDN70DRAFT_893314 [Pholiota conissans]